MLISTNLMRTDGILRAYGPEATHVLWCYASTP